LLLLSKSHRTKGESKRITKRLKMMWSLIQIQWLLFHASWFRHLCFLHLVINSETQSEFSISSLFQVVIYDAPKEHTHECIYYENKRKYVEVLEKVNRKKMEMCEW